MYAENNVAVLGYVTWSPNIEVTPFLKYLEETGVQFGYPMIRDPDRVGYNFFYTANVSVRRSFLIEYGLFDEDFPYAAWEDIELAYRLEKAGLQIKYNRCAVGYHDHRIDQKGFSKRSTLSGRALAVLHQKHPELTKGVNFHEKHEMKTIVKLLIWRFPPALGRIIPKKYLYASYNTILARYIRQGYLEWQRLAS